jgi:hypothetical protein
MRTEFGLRRGGAGVAQMAYNRDARRYPTGSTRLIRSGVIPALNAANTSSSVTRGGNPAV